METNEQLKQLLKEHLKQQKTTSGISNFLQDIFKEAVQKLLKARNGELSGNESTHPKPPNSPITAMAKAVRRYEVN